jgi:hypothetical protein
VQSSDVEAGEQQLREHEQVQSAYCDAVLLALARPHTFLHEIWAQQINDGAGR